MGDRIGGDYVFTLFPGMQNMTATAYYENTFQTPNAFVDEVLQWLTKDEGLALFVVTRELLGWNKTSAPVSYSTIQKKAPLSRKQIGDALRGLCEFGILRAVGKATSDGQVYQMADIKTLEGVRWDALKARFDRKKKRGRSRTKKARETLSNERSVSETNQPEGGQSDKPVVSQSNQQAVSETNQDWLAGLTDQTHINPINPKDSAPTGADAPPMAIPFAMDTRQDYTPALPPDPPAPPKKKQRQKDLLFEAVFQAVYDQSYDPDNPPEKTMASYTGKIKRAVQGVNATPEEVTAAAAWHKGGRDEKRCQLTIPSNVALWPKMIKEYRQSARFKQTKVRYVGGKTREEFEIEAAAIIAASEAERQSDPLVQAANAAYAAIMRGEEPAESKLQ